MRDASTVGGMAGGIGGLTSIARWWRDSVAEPVLSVLFPPRCVVCGDFESYLCASCRDTLEPIETGCCPRCGEPGPLPLVGGRCTRCMGQEVTYAGACAAFRHQGAARELVTGFKFGGQPVLGRVMADLAQPAFTRFVASVGRVDGVVVTWVPSHRSVQRERGYNQAEVLARRLVAGSRPLGAGRPSLTLAPLVRKLQATRHQKGLGKAGRQGNLRGAFALDESACARLPARTGAVILIDDVYTTGATAKEVSSVLASGMRLPVHVFTFSRAISGASERHD